MFIDFALSVLTHGDILLVWAFSFGLLLIHVKVEVAGLRFPLFVIEVALVSVN